MAHLNASLATSVQYTEYLALPLPVSYDTIEDNWYYDSEEPTGVLLKYVDSTHGDVYIDGDLAPNYPANSIQLDISFNPDLATTQESEDEIKIESNTGEDTMILLGIITEGTQGLLTYIAGNGGEIEGVTQQYGNIGVTGTEVTAIPDDDYIFVEWSDGLNTASRTDLIKNITYTAYFAQKGADVDVFTQYKD